MKKTLVFLGFAVVLIGSITLGWHLTHRPSSAAKQDYAQVYNAHQSKIATITNHQKISYLSNLLGDLGSARRVHPKKPQNGQLLRHFKIVQINPSAKIDAFIYRNHTITVKNLPVVHSGTWHLSSQQYQKLTHLR